MTRHDERRPGAMSGAATDKRRPNLKSASSLPLRAFAEALRDALARGDDAEIRRLWTEIEDRQVMCPHCWTPTSPWTCSCGQTWINEELER